MQNKNNLQLEVHGPDGWCFGIEFWIQAALFERCGYSDFKIDVTWHKDTIDVAVSRTICTSYHHGVKKSESGERAILVAPQFYDNIYSWRAIQKWARDVVAKLQFEDWETNLLG